MVMSLSIHVIIIILYVPIDISEVTPGHIMLWHPRIHDRGVLLSVNVFTPEFPRLLFIRDEY